MKKNIFKTTVVLLFFVVSVTAFGQIRTYSDLKMDKNGITDRNAFNTAYGHNYSQWDRNGDKTLTNREFYEATYSRLDINKDKYLSKEEWDNGYRDVYGEYVDTHAYVDWDKNQDGKISDIEYYNGFNTSDFYNSYDVDGNGNITRDELNERVYFNWDKNQDGNIDENEYNSYSIYYTDNDGTR